MVPTPGSNSKLPGIVGVIIMLSGVFVKVMALSTLSDMVIVPSAE